MPLRDGAQGRHRLVPDRVRVAGRGVVSPATTPLANCSQPPLAECNQTHLPLPCNLLSFSFSNVVQLPTTNPGQTPHPTPPDTATKHTCVHLIGYLRIHRTRRQSSMTGSSTWEPLLWACCTTALASGSRGQGEAAYRRRGVSKGAAPAGGCAAAAAAAAAAAVPALLLPTWLRMLLPVSALRGVSRFSTGTGCCCAWRHAL
jgi:hypothetical protein